MLSKVLRKYRFFSNGENKTAVQQLAELMDMSGRFFQFLGTDNPAEKIIYDCFEVLKDFYNSSLQADLFFLQVEKELEYLEGIEQKPYRILSARLNYYHAEKMNAERVEFIKGLKALYFPDVVHFWREITCIEDEEIIRTAIGMLPKEWKQEYLRREKEWAEYERECAENENK